MQGKISIKRELRIDKKIHRNNKTMKMLKLKTTMKQKKKVGKIAEKEVNLEDKTEKGVQIDDRIDK